jgi:hypothetical protein
MLKIYIIVFILSILFGLIFSFININKYDITIYPKNKKQIYKDDNNKYYYYDKVYIE